MLPTLDSRHVHACTCACMYMYMYMHVHVHACIVCGVAESCISELYVQELIYIALLYKIVSFWKWLPWQWCVLVDYHRDPTRPVPSGPTLLVCDEGHRIKNDATTLSQALKKIATKLVRTCTCSYMYLYM